jgi:hypothetical protein
MYKIMNIVLVALAAFALEGSGLSIPHSSLDQSFPVTSLLSPGPDNASNWVDTWGAMPQLTEPGNVPPEPFV